MKLCIYRQLKIKPSCCVAVEGLLIFHNQQIHTYILEMNEMSSNFFSPARPIFGMADHVTHTGQSLGSFRICRVKGKPVDSSVQSISYHQVY